MIGLHNPPFWISVLYILAWSILPILGAWLVVSAIEKLWKSRKRTQGRRR